MAGDPEGQPGMPQAPDPSMGQGGVLVSGQIRDIIGDVVGRDKITYNFADPRFEAELRAFFDSRDASNTARSALATNLVALSLATVFVDQMRLLYITTGTRMARANAHLYSHFVERAERDLGEFRTYMERYAAQLDPALQKAINAVERRCSRVCANFSSQHPLFRGQAALFSEMQSAVAPMYEVLTFADPEGLPRTVALVDSIGRSAVDLNEPLAGLKLADEIAILRFRMQDEALKGIQQHQDNRIYTIDDDVDANFAPVYFLIDRWIFSECSPHL